MVRLWRGITQPRWRADGTPLLTAAAPLYSVARNSISLLRLVTSFPPSFLPRLVSRHFEHSHLTLTTYMIHSAFRVLDRSEVRDVADLCALTLRRHTLYETCALLLDCPHLTLTLCLKVMRLYSSNFLFHQLCPFHNR